MKRILIASVAVIALASPAFAGSVAFGAAVSASGVSTGPGFGAAVAGNTSIGLGVGGSAHGTHGNVSVGLGVASSNSAGVSVGNVTAAGGIAVGVWRQHERPRPRPLSRL